MKSAASIAYIMEDQREAMRLELKVDPESWVDKYLSDLLKPAMNVLSVGCGPGVILQALCSRHQSIRGTGIDISAARVQQASEKHNSNPRLNFVHADAHALPIPSDSFELVYSRMLFEYLADKDQVMAEMVRVCRPGGTVVVQDLDGQLLWNYPEDPDLQGGIERVLAGLATTGFDPFVGRKLFTLAYRGGLEDVHVQVECYHLIAGEITNDILKQWELKLDIALPQIARILGSEDAAREQAKRLLEYLRRPDTLTYSNVFTVKGRKPSRHQLDCLDRYTVRTE
jgi:ubiquinone/menaquinone biosynthesis C-methylase UbiE